MTGSTQPLKDADFLPNPNRAIWLRGEFNQALLDRLAPQIQRLTSQSRSSITVYLDSEGGSTKVGRKILSLLRSADGNGSSPCAIITVATKALSAAAEFLSAADWAVANPGGELLYHASRIPPPAGDVITAKQAAVLAESFQELDELDVLSFAKNCARRFLFLTLVLRAEFEKYRFDSGNPALTDLSCFQEVLHLKLSRNGQRVVESAATYCDSYAELLARFHEKMEAPSPLGKADIEDIMLSASVDFERESKKNDPSWSLACAGLYRINRHFSFLSLCFQISNDAELFRRFFEDRSMRQILAVYEPDLRSEEETAEKMRTYFLPFWPFLIAIGRALQDGDHRLSASDAYWLGLIDTCVS